MFWACTMGLLVGILLAPSVVTLAAPLIAESAGLDTGPTSGVLGVATLVLSMMAVYSVVHACGMGSPKERDTPEQEWEKGRWG